jgi:hypothetical protein
MRQECAPSSKETVPVISCALLVMFVIVILADIQNLPKAQLGAWALQVAASSFRNHFKHTHTRVGELVNCDHLLMPWNSGIVDESRLQLYAEDVGACWSRAADDACTSSYTDRAFDRAESTGDTPNCR